MIRTIFDTRYVEYFNRATKDVPLLYALYFLCIPLAKLLRTLGLSPTWITHLSNLLALAAICALVWASNPWWFPLLWFLALCFDIADGVVARASKSASASGSFYDHISDQVKIIGLFFAVGARYDDPRIWIMAYAINSAFLLAAVVNPAIDWRGRRCRVRSRCQCRGCIARIRERPSCHLEQLASSQALPQRNVSQRVFGLWQFDGVAPVPVVRKNRGDTDHVVLLDCDGKRLVAAVQGGASGQSAANTECGAMEVVNTAPVCVRDIASL